MKFEAKKILRAPAAVLMFGAAMGLAIPAAGLAEEAKPRVAKVQVSDLNLSTTGGQRKLERRTAAAINEVCPIKGSAAGPRSSQNAAHRECAQAVRQSVKEQIDQRGGRAVAGRG